MAEPIKVTHYLELFDQSDFSMCFFPSKTARSGNTFSLDSSCASVHYARDVDLEHQLQAVKEIHEAVSHEDGFILVDKILQYAILMRCMHHRHEKFLPAMEAKAYLLAMTMRGCNEQDKDESEHTKQGMDDDDSDEEEPPFKEHPYPAQHTYPAQLPHDQFMELMNFIPSAPRTSILGYSDVSGDANHAPHLCRQIDVVERGSPQPKNSASGRS